MANFAVFLLLIMFSLTTAYKPSSRNGFTVDLIHRDSPLSPSHNPSSTRFDNIANAVHRSIHRKTWFMNRISGLDSTNSIESDLTSAAGEYLMKIAIGTPPLETVANADTGSDLLWTQCQPCTDCFEQAIPFFKPNASSTYKQVPCKSKPCQALPSYVSSCSSKNVCEYSMSYGDGSTTYGDLASETFTFGSSTSSLPVKVENVIFGCGHDNSGTFKNDTSGIVGLGGGPLSIVNQLYDIVDGKFSYCLVPMFNETRATNMSSKIMFGSDAEVSGSGVVSTPLVAKDPDTYYYLTLESISVGGGSEVEKISIRKKADDDVEGNMIIDSGTTLTFVPEELYYGLETSLEKAIKGGKRVDAPTGDFELCYKNLDMESVPTITFHFTDADLELSPTNTFLEIVEGMTCLTLVQSDSDSVAIFGNLSQQNFLVGYDLVNKKVSFKPTDSAYIWILRLLLGVFDQSRKAQFPVQNLLFTINNLEY